jgi:MFS family permease
MAIILFIPDKYFSSTSHQISNKQRRIKEKEKVNTFFCDTTNDKTEFQNLTNLSGVSNNKNCLSEFYQIISKPIFLLCNFTLACLFFILTVIQFQGSEYMETAMEVTNPESRLISFAIICLTSPTLGILGGSFLINFQGGYETRHSILICLIASVLSGLFTIPATFANNLFMFTLFLWCVLFFGAAIVPPLNGIIMSSLPRDLIATANSIVIMICNLFGFFPAPFLYATIKDLYGNNKSAQEQEKFAMKISLYYSMFGVFLLFIATIVRYKVYDKIYGERKMTDEPSNISMRAQSKTFITQYMNGMVSGIEEDDNNIQDNENIDLLNDNNSSNDTDKKYMLFNEQNIN